MPLLSGGCTVVPQETAKHSDRLSVSAPQSDGFRSAMTRVDGKGSPRAAPLSPPPSQTAVFAAHLSLFPCPFSPEVCSLSSYASLD